MAEQIIIIKIFLSVGTKLYVMNSSHAGLQGAEEEKVRAGKDAVVIGGTKLYVMNSSHAGLQGFDACNVQGIGGGISRDQSVW